MNRVNKLFVYMVIGYLEFDLKLFILCVIFSYFKWVDILFIKISFINKLD